MRKLGLVLLLSIAGTVAANAAGDNVVLIAVKTVDVPAQLPGVCAVSGTITRVEDGKAFHAGQAISLKVPCRGNDATLIPALATDGPAGPRFISAQILKESHQGLARIDDNGALLWDYTKHSYGPWGLAGGYRVMDGAVVPAFP